MELNVHEALDNSAIRVVNVFDEGIEGISHSCLTGNLQCSTGHPGLHVNLLLPLLDLGSYSLPELGFMFMSGKCPERPVIVLTLSTTPQKVGYK